MTSTFRTTIREQLGELRTAKTADDVTRILAHDRNPYRSLPGSVETTGTGDGYYAGGDAGDVWDALDDAGWEQVWSSPKPGEGHCYYVMRAPDGSVITYIEGDIYRGDKRPKNES